MGKPVYRWSGGRLMTHVCVGSLYLFQGEYWFRKYAASLPLDERSPTHCTDLKDAKKVIATLLILGNS